MVELVFGILGSVRRALGQRLDCSVERQQNTVPEFQKIQRCPLKLAIMSLPEVLLPSISTVDHTLYYLDMSDCPSTTHDISKRKRTQLQRVDEHGNR